MELFRETSLQLVWPICICLWTLMALVSLGESWAKHRHVVKSISRLDRRLEKLEKQRGKVSRNAQRGTYGRPGIHDDGSPTAD